MPFIDPLEKSSFIDPLEQEAMVKEKMGNTFDKALGYAEAIGTMPFRAVASIPLMAGTGVAALGALAGGKSLDDVSSGIGDVLSVPFHKDSYFTKEGAHAQENLGRLLYEEPKTAVGEFSALTDPKANIGGEVSREKLLAEAANRGQGEMGFDALMMLLGLKGLTGQKGGGSGLSAEAQAELVRRQAELQKSKPGFIDPLEKETPLPKLNEQPLHLPEEPAQPTAFPTLNEVPVQPEIPKGTTTFPEQPVPTHPNPLELTPNDVAVPHTPNPQFENVVPRAPDQPMNPGLLDPSIEAQRIKDMQTNTGINQVRSEFPSIDFPLRQEVLQDPKIKAAIDAFREEDAKLQGNPELQAKLREEFAAGMRQLGIDKPQDAFGRGLFESGQGTKLPIEKTNRPALPSSGKQGWTAIVDHEPLAIKYPPKRIGGGSQLGQIHPDLLTFGVSKLLRDLGPEKLLDKFSGTFSPDAIKFAKRNTSNPLSRETTVFMSPERFLELAAPRTWGPETSLAKEKQRNIREVLKTKDGLEDIPFLYTEDGRVTSHEGRHRADVFKELGLDLMPVRITDRTTRWGQSGLKPDIESLVSEGRAHMSQRFGQRGAIDRQAFVDGIKELAKNTERTFSQILPKAGDIVRLHEDSGGKDVLITGMEEKPSGLYLRGKVRTSNNISGPEWSAIGDSFHISNFDLGGVEKHLGSTESILGKFAPKKQRGALDPSVIAEGLDRQARALSRLTDRLDLTIPKTAPIERNADSTPKVLLHGTNSKASFSKLKPGPDDMFVHASSGPVPATIVAGRVASNFHNVNHPYLSISARELKGAAEQEPWVKGRMEGILDHHERDIQYHNSLHGAAPLDLNKTKFIAPRTMAFTLKKGNYPLIKDLGVWNPHSVLEGMRNAGMITAERFKALEAQMKNSFTKEKILGDELKRMGIDGFRYHNDYERFGGELTESYAVLNPDHLSSIWDGKNSAYSGGKQRGSVTPNVFVEGLKKLATSSDYMFKNLLPKAGDILTWRKDSPMGHRTSNAVEVTGIEVDTHGRIRVIANARNAYGDLEEIRGFLSNFEETKKLGIELLQGETEKLSQADLLADKVRQNFNSKERGSIGDPKFLKFKESLPEPLKKEASAMYKEWLKMQRGKPVEVTPGKTTESAISKIPGMSKIIDEIAPIDERPWKELRDIALNEPEVKMGRMARGLYSGADLAGFAKKSTLIRYVGDVVNNHFRKADVFIRDLLLDKDNGLKPAIDKLTKEEQVQLHEAMKRAEGTDTPVQFDNPKLAEAHQRYRNVMNTVFSGINEVRSLLKMTPLPARPNYMPSRWLGDWHIPVTDIHGNFLNILTANTRRGARKAAEFMQEKYPEYHFGEVEYKPLTKASGDLETGYRELMNIFGEDDPRVKTIQEAYEQLIADKGYEFQGFKRHFKARKAEGVRGFEGDKGWLSPEENARDGFQAGLKYAEQALRWAEVQKAALKVKEVIADKQVGLTHPEAMKYVEAYWNRASGKDSMVARAIDSLVDQAAQITGVGRGAIVDTGHVIKKAMTLKFLGFMNVAFLGSQAYQPYQMLGHWMSYLHDRGANANLLVTSNKALMDLVSAPERMTPEGRAAYDWAKKNHIFDSYILDDIRSATSKPWLDATDAVMSWAPNKIEGFSRANFYFNIFHQLHESGITGVEAYKTAAKITDMGMTNYKMHERPLVYRELGAIGDMASSLTTFKHNQYSQLAAMGKEGRKSNLMPMITAQLMAGGLLGFYGRDEIDSLIKFFNEQSANGHWDVPYIPTLREAALKNAPDWAAFGGVSQITGMDMSSRFSAGNIFPDSPMEMFFPFYQDIKQMAASAYDVGMKQTGESALKAANAMSPSSLKWITEEFGYRTPSGMYQSPGTGLGSYKRDAGDTAARVLGGWTKKESRDRQSVMEMKGENQWVQTMKKGLTEAYINTNSPEKRAEYARRYGKMGGNPQDLVNALVEKTKQKELSARQRESGLPNITNTNKAFQFLRGKEYPK